MAIDSRTENILKQKAVDYGIPYPIIYAIVGLETGGTFDVNTIGDSGDSFGLFQINKPSHRDFDITKYTDVKYQADFQLPELKKYYDQGLQQGLSGSELAHYVEVYGQRPDYKNADVKAYVDSAIPKYYNEAVGNFTDSRTGVPAMATSTENKNSWLEQKIVDYLGVADEAVREFNGFMFFTILVVVAIVITGFSIYQVAK